MTEGRKENVAVLFTDIVGSTDYFKVHGDIAGRKLLLEHQNAVGEAVGSQGGVIVKTIGDSVLAWFNDPVGALESAIFIQDSNREYNRGRSPEEQIRIRIAIHYGPVIIENEDIFGDIVNRASRLKDSTEGGDICVSRQMVDQVQGAGPWAFEQVDIEDWDVITETTVFRVLCELRKGAAGPSSGKAGIPGEFRHRHQLIRGRHQPCFYCGSRKHLMAECPSKEVPEITKAFEKLGYMSVDEINNLFSEYLKRGCPGSDGAVMAAHHAFYDLKRVFQFRFFRCVWDTGRRDWSEVSTSMPSGYKGGHAWLVQDCIRVSNYARAEELLNEAEDDMSDYKICVASAFLNMEKGFAQKAERNIHAALRLAEASPERMFVLFLLYRFATVISKNETEAKRRLNEILAITRCPEADYLGIVHMIQNKEPAGLKRLEKLIRDERAYYVAAMIDPDLQADSVDVTVMLTRLVNEAREAAMATAKNATAALDWLVKSFEEDNDSVKMARATWNGMQDLLKGSGYFCFLDAERCGQEILLTYEREMNLQKRALYTSHQSIRRRADDCSYYLKKHEGGIVNVPCRQEMEELEDGIKKLYACSRSDNPSKIRGAFALADDLKARVTDVEKRLKKFETVRCLQNFAWKFLMNVAVVAALAALGAFLFVPILWHTIRGMETLFQTDLDHCKRTIFVTGIIAGSGLSFVNALKVFFEE
jgi:class 3 adenylate cyclase